MEKIPSQIFKSRYRTPSQCKIVLKSIGFWLLILSDANQPSKRITYCKNRLKYFTPEKIAYLKQNAAKVKIKKNK